MLISYSHNFLFQHIPKTAGSSLYEQLEPYGHKPEQLLVNRLLAAAGVRVNLFIGPHSWKRFRGHTDLRTVQRVLPAGVFRSVYKFAFVRNPWDWLVSRYCFIKQSPRHGQHERVSRLGGFAEYVRWQGARRRRGQSELLVDKRGKLLVDFLGRYETLAEDFVTIGRQIDVEVATPSWRNASRRGDYREFYDDATREYVQDRWRHDIEGFGYEFENGYWAARPTSRAA